MSKSWSAAPRRSGGYHVIVPALPEIVTYGETLDEGREMAKDTIRCVLESIRKENEPVPHDVETPPPVRERLTLSL
jgi:predicted RNase H-like HicB family nuclease